MRTAKMDQEGRATTNEEARLLGEAGLLGMAARVLRAIGADRVSVVAAARTPLKRARARSDTEDNVAR